MKVTAWREVALTYFNVALLRGDTLLFRVRVCLQMFEIISIDIKLILVRFNDVCV